jgi:hypothetical protein
MQKEVGFSGDDFEVGFTDGGKAVIQDEVGWFAEIDLRLYQAGIIQEIEFYSTAERVEEVLEPDRIEMLQPINDKVKRG